MPFSEIELARIDRLVGGLCARRNRPEFKEQLSFEYRVKGHDVTVFERRPKWRGTGITEHGVAKLRFVRRAGEWRLFWMRADLKWHSYTPAASSTDLPTLVAQVDTDPNGCFFG
jgi:hypothetical protein